MVVGFQKDPKLELVNGGCVEIFYFLGVKRKRSSRVVVVFVFRQPMLNFFQTLMRFADLHIHVICSTIALKTGMEFADLHLPM